MLAWPERDVHAAEAYASATLLAILMLFWGAVALPVVPPVFRPLDLSHVVLGIAGMVYFPLTRRRPRTSVAYLYCAVVIVHTLVALPWTTLVWTEARRPFEAVTVPQVAMLSMALIVPRSLVVGLVVTALFMAEGVFVTVWAHHVGQAALLPVGAPYVTIYLGFPAIVLLLLRDQRRRLAHRHIKLQAETAALRRLGPLFTRVRDELAAQLAVVSRELVDRPAAASRSMGRAVKRLTDVNARLGSLVDTQLHVDAERERAFVAHDVQLGAFVLAITTSVMALGWAPVAAVRIGLDTGLRTGFLGVVGVVMTVVLAASWHRPSELRGRVAILFLFAIALTVMSIDATPHLRHERPFTPFLGHKILMVLLGITAASWSSMGMPLIIATAVDALALYFILGFNTLKHRIALVEPWAIVAFAVIGLLALTMRDQRRVASLAVLREEASASALHRRATMLLALRDQLNSPLQTLVAAEARAALTAPADDVAALRAGIARLVALSRELAQIEVPSESQVATLDERSLTKG